MYNQSQVITHSGGFKATRADLLAVAAPENSRTYKAVRHVELLDTVSAALPTFGLELARESYALARDGRQMFAVLDVTGGTTRPDYRLAIGLRNSYDKSLAAGLCAGSRVFVCDNLAFNGEVRTDRRHTIGVHEDLPRLIGTMLRQLTTAYVDQQDADISTLKGAEIRGQAHLDHLLMEALRRGVVPASALMDVHKEYEHPRHPEFADRSAWSLMNAFTETFKQTSGPLQFERSLELSRLFRDRFGAVKTAEFVDVTAN